MFHTASQCRNGNVTFRGTIPDITSRRRHCTGCLIGILTTETTKLFRKWWFFMVINFMGSNPQKKQIQLVGGFNQPEKYQSNWIISPNRGNNKKCLKPPTSQACWEVQHLTNPQHWSHIKNSVSEIQSDVTQKDLSKSVSYPETNSKRTYKTSHSKRKIIFQFPNCVLLLLLVSERVKWIFRSRTKPSSIFFTAGLALVVEKYDRQIGSSPSKFWGKNKASLKPPPLQNMIGQILVGSIIFSRLVPDGSTNALRITMMVIVNDDDLPWWNV